MLPSANKLPMAVVTIAGLSLSGALVNVDTAQASPLTTHHSAKYKKSQKSKKSRTSKKRTQKRNCRRSTRAPYMVFTKGKGRNTQGGTLHMWVTIDGCRKYYKTRAGSGLSGRTNTCRRAVGPIPNGRTKITGFYNKTWGHRTVRGHVWRLGNMRCPTGKRRTALFIHSNGGPKKRFNGRYDSNGCIKISQAGRKRFAAAYKRASNKKGATLVVRSHRSER